MIVRLKELAARFRRPHGGFWLYAAHVATIWGIALSNLFLGLMILWAARHRRRLRRDWHGVAPVLAPLGAYAVLLVVAVVASYEPASSVAGLKELLSLATLALGVVLVRGERQVRLVFDLVTATIALLAVVGIAQYFFTAYGDLHHRIVAVFSHYQTYAGILLLGDLLLFARVLARRRDRWTYPALVAVNWALLLTLTRGAWVALAVTLALAGVAFTRRRLAVGLVAALVVVALVVSRLAGPWQERLRSIDDLQDASNYDRLCMLEAGVAMVSERPLLGLGPRMVKERYPIYRNPTAPRFTVPHLHDAYLDLAAERGLLSLAAYLWLLAASFSLTFRVYRREGGLDGGRADLHLGVILALVGFSVAALFENNWGDTEVQRLVLFLLAVPCCLEPGTDRVGERSELSSSSCPRTISSLRTRISGDSD